MTLYINYFFKLTVVQCFIYTYLTPSLRKKYQGFFLDEQTGTHTKKSIWA